MPPTWSRGQLLSNHGDQFPWNDFVVLNNQWGREWADAGSYQHIGCDDRGENGVSFEFGWSGAPTKIKGFPVVMAGWHFGSPGGWMTPRGHKGLPSAVDACRPVPVSCRVTYARGAVGQAEIMNVAWDVWFARDAEAMVPCNEIMVWPWHLNQVPIGERVATVDAWGAAWDLYAGQVVAGGAAWRVFSFVRQQGALCVAGNLGDFITNIRDRGWLEVASQVVGVEFGSELLSGCGTFRIERYTQD